MALIGRAGQGKRQGGAAAVLDDGARQEGAETGTELREWL